MLKMTKRMDSYYKAWINSKTLIGTQNDLELFYKFANSLIQLGRKPRDEEWLYKYLVKDIPESKFKDKSKVIEEIIEIYCHIFNFHYVKFPDHLIEMKNPIMVEIELENMVDKNGNSIYSRSEISDILVKHFGPDWENDFFKEHYGKSKDELIKF